MFLFKKPEENMFDWKCKKSASLKKYKIDFLKWRDCKNPILFSVYILLQTLSTWSIETDISHQMCCNNNINHWDRLTIAAETSCLLDQNYNKAAIFK